MAEAAVSTALNIGNINFLQLIRKRAEIFVSIGVVAILVVMLIPLPPILLDLLLSLSISIAVVIVIISVYVQKPLDFSVFPTMLLITTLYRLSLNVATTRLILIHGHEGTEAAGQVIQSFGNFVIGGNYAVGLIIFLILIIVNFVVITKGSGRIAEVAARFTLDAMPGKQMAIDADLNAGLIDEKGARKRRESIAQEADFYGAMDGASKFVRGDAIAALIITAINIFGGIIIGVLQKGMPIVDALKTYTVLSVGDGLVSQVPALLISTAAGLVVSRAGKESDLGKDISEQVIVNPKALYTTSGILFAFAIVPGLPHLPFLLIAAGAAGLAYVITAAGKKEAAEQLLPEAPPEEPKIEAFTELDPLTLEIGYGLIPIVEEQKGELLSKIKSMRRQLAREIGFVIPPVHIRDNLQLRPHEYSFSLKGIEVAKYEIMMGNYLAVASEDTQPIEGIPAKEPAFGLPALWVEPSRVEEAQLSGYMVVDNATVIATHLTELIRKHCWELLSRSEVQNILDSVSKSYPKIVEELMSITTLGNVQRVMQSLLRERVPINDVMAILETILDYGPQMKDPEVLTEFARQALSRHITKQYAAPDGSIPVFTLDQKYENMLLRSLQTGDAISPNIVSKMVKGLETLIESESYRGVQPIVLTSAQVRRHIKKLMEKFLPSVIVLSNAEISAAGKLFTLGVVRYED
ncbi:flagellar biosynthesis protein FlhA [Candidatus Magnetominusculus xianensis]|uniref:Flagellar biosynthesis protein FlhA n=1 Tax=Candidatus Magnetominusculus xianensis TaxID=1748249 RepID=A0ABR5SE68_9BACT|nr:flagellar biosynthesis protein FlhA [Candidatus Magnetominusculus xianensis]KWT84086.1 flagellar biosynthesis protein FlhA [Candidatus Magnetominusculus xianensis]MBF0402379.1 flagellar biosynthesis protein FlhA [Nitrospirota bacterium]